MIRENSHVTVTLLLPIRDHVRCLILIEQNPQFWEMADDKEVEKTIAEDLVVTKYKLAGQIVNRKLFASIILF